MCASPINFFSGAFLPEEILSCTFNLLPAKQLLELKSTCSKYKNFIDSDPSSQVRIAELYLIKKQLHANIPLGDLKYFLRNTNLVLEIKGDFNVFHLAHDLTPIIPWIKHLIIKNCGTDQLTNLINLLKNSKQLSTLFLYECSLDQMCIVTLQNLSNPTEFKFCCCNIECNLSDPLHRGELGKIKIISKEDAHQFDIENLETGSDGLEEFEQQVSNEIASATDVLEVFDSIKNTVRAGVITSIWHAILMKPEEEPKPIDYITNQTRLYIEKNPHHPAVIAAARTMKERRTLKNRL